MNHPNPVGHWATCTTKNPWDGSDWTETGVVIRAHRDGIVLNARGAASNYRWGEDTIVIHELVQPL